MHEDQSSDEQGPGWRQGNDSILDLFGVQEELCGRGDIWLEPDNQCELANKKNTSTCGIRSMVADVEAVCMRYRCVRGREKGHREGEHDVSN